MTLKEAYKILGASKHDDDREIKAKYKKLLIMFSSYGIRSLCKIFCNTDRIAYSGLTRHATFVRHSDLSDGEACFDEIIGK